MLDVLQGFVHELRAAGLPVSMTENLDAMRAVEHVAARRPRDVQGRARRDAREAPPATGKVFDTVFEVYFSLFSPGVDGDGGGRRRRPAPTSSSCARRMEAGGGDGQRCRTRSSREMLLDALMNMDREQLRRLAAAAVAAVRGHGAGPAGRRHVLPLPHAAAARRSTASSRR